MGVTQRTDESRPGTSAPCLPRPGPDRGSLHWAGASRSAGEGLKYVRGTGRYVRVLCLDHLTFFTFLAFTAACGGAHPSTTIGAVGGTTVGVTITIDPAPPDADFGTIGFDDHGALPAISADGTLVAALFHDTTDFVGLPVDTLVVWRIADGARVAAVASNDRTPPSDDDSAPDPATGARQVALATAALAGKRGLRAPTLATTANAESGEATTITVADGRLLHYEYGELALPDGRVGGLDSPGEAMDEGDGGGGGCGSIYTVKVLAGGDADWLLLAPDYIQLGGDNCSGKLEADLAQLVRVGR